jgi:hypothetical protein
MKIRTLCRSLALSLLAFQMAVSADYISNFSSFPAYPYNTSSYKQSGAFVGCGPTTGAMILAYFQAVHSLTGLLTNPGTGTDAGLNTAWALHGQSYMKTDATGFGKVVYIKTGLEQYASGKGFSVKVTIHVGSSYSDPNSSAAAWLNAYGTYGDAWTNDGVFWQNSGTGSSIDSDKFCDFLAVKFAQGIPIFLTIDTKAAGEGDHWVPMVGYDKSAKKYAYYDTYDTNLHWADIYYSGDPAGKKANSIVMVRTVAYTPPSTGSDIAVDYPSMNFGSITVGDHSTQYLTVSNSGTADLSVTATTLSGTNSADFSVLNGAPFTLAAGNARQIGLRFSPAAPGSRSASLSIASNDPDENPLTVSLSGTGGGGSGAPQWQKAASLGKGEVTSLAVIGNSVFAATRTGGVFHSTDGGTAWNAANGTMTNPDIRTLLASGSRLYAGTWGDGVFYTDDKGAHWTQIKTGLGNLYVTSLAVDPLGVDGWQRLLAGTWGGSYLSTDHGQTWTGANTGMTETHVRSVLLSGSSLFAGTINGLFRSSDGQAWTAINNGLTNKAVISLKQRGVTLYAGTDGGGVFFSVDQGDSWIGYFLNQDSFVIPDMAALGIDLFVGTWGTGVLRITELEGNDNMEEGLTEMNVRSLAVLCADGSKGQWKVLAGTQNGNVWAWPLEKEYAIVVDGEKDAFYGGLSGPSDGYLQLRSYAWNNNGKPDNDNDLSAKIWTAWDDGWFYLYEEVKDNAVSGNAPNVWEEDCVELMFDPQPSDVTVNSVWSTRLTALDQATASVSSWDDMNNIGQNAWRQWCRKTVTGGYVLELAIRWQAITGNGEKITPQAGTQFGMAVNQHDNDGNAKRDATVQWAAVLNDSVWNTPKYLGTVKFLSDHKLQFIASNKMTGATNPVPYDGSDYTRTGVADASTGSPNAFILMQNYPNPFNPETAITYTVAGPGRVRLTVSDLLGREVAVLTDGMETAGTHTVRFDASHLPGGMYLCRIETPEGVQSNKMMLMK